MSKSIKYFLLLLFISSTQGLAQSIDFTGQISGIGSFSPDNSRPYLLGARFIPQIEFNISSEDETALDFVVAVNLSATSLFKSFDKSLDLSAKPYRVWARYSSEQYEVRVGLQKIDFGSSSLLRPLQWFNQVDPRDPLQITNGVYGLLGRYYFLNNSNLWLWALIGNDERRGTDILAPRDDYPELGGRFQYPVGNGELAMSIHHRKVDGELSLLDEVFQNRIGIDGKFDYFLGLWFEATLALTPEVGTRQVSLGGDYSLAIGNGLNLGAEYLLYTFSNRELDLSVNRHLSAMNLSYPLSFFDQISGVIFYDWTNDSANLFLNYGHQFSKFDTYVMAFYNSSGPALALVDQEDFIDTFVGPGIRGMVVVNL